MATHIGYPPRAASSGGRAAEYIENLKNEFENTSHELHMYVHFNFISPYTGYTKARKGGKGVGMGWRKREYEIEII